MDEQETIDVTNDVDERDGSKLGVERLASPFDLSIREWCDYWEQGNDTYRSDERSCDPLTRDDLAKAASLLRTLMETLDEHGIASV